MYHKDYCQIMNISWSQFTFLDRIKSKLSKPDGQVFFSRNKFLFFLVGTWFLIVFVATNLKYVYIFVKFNRMSKSTLGGYLWKSSRSYTQSSFVLWSTLTSVLMLSLNFCLIALPHSMTDAYFLKFKEGENRKTHNPKKILCTGKFLRY